MSIFSRIGDEVRSVLASAPAKAWETEFQSLGTRTNSGRRVNRKSALQMIAVYSCISLIADAIASLPVDHYTKLNGKRTMFDGSRSPRWVRQPNPYQTAFEFWHRVIVSLLTDGNAFIFTDRNDRGDVTALYVLHPEDVYIVEKPLGDNLYQVAGFEKLQDRSQILHIPAFTVPGCSRGVSPIDIAREAIGLGLTAEEYGARFFDQGTTMAGVIEHPGTPRPDEAKLLREMFRKTHSGVKNSHSIGVLTGGAQFRPITLTPEQAQFLETRRFQKTEIALLYRIPAYLVDSQVTSTWGSGIEEQNKFFVDQTLMPWLTRLEQSISTFLLPGFQYVRFNVDARLRAKTLDRYHAYAQAVSNGFMNADEIRALEDLEPLPKKLGQKFYVPANLMEVTGEKKPAAQIAPPASPPVPPPPDPNAQPDQAPTDLGGTSP